MQLIANTSGLFGTFDLLPDEGWTISHHFTDYESKLLVVVLSPTDKSAYKAWYGIVSTPTQTVVINAEVPEILNYEKWRNYFNYNEVIEKNEEEQLMSVTQRIYDADKDTDSIKYRLINTATGKQLLEGSGIAFYNRQHDNIIARYLKDRADRQAYEAKQQQFLSEKYRHFTTQQKAQYHIGNIHRQERMQGGIPSGYTTRAAIYFSKWFYDMYISYDNNITDTLTLIAHEFGVKTTYLDTMIHLDSQSPEWQQIADKIGLIEKL